MGSAHEADRLRARVLELEQLNAELQTSEERLKILFEHAPDGYYLSDLKGTFTDGNKVAEEITGYKRDELIGKSFLKLKLLPAEQLPRAAALLAKSVLGRSTGPEEFSLNRKDGSIVTVEIRTHPVRIAGQRLVLGIARDISVRKQAEKSLQESEERFRDLFDNAHDLVQSIGADGHFRYVNRAWLETLGYTSAEMSKLTIYDVLHPDFHSQHVEIFHSLSDGEQIARVEAALVSKTGDRIEIEGSVSCRFREGELVATRGILRDITERTRMEKALHERVKELSCLYGISSLVETPEVSLEEIIQGTVDLIPPSWQYPEVTCARLTLQGKEYKTRNFRETTWRQSSDIAVAGEPAGCVEVCYLEERPESDEGPFLKEERFLISSIAERVSRIAERLQLEEKLDRMARHDPLTGVHNRHALNEFLERELTRSKRYNHPIGILLIDVNRFKEINDRFGHAMGDKVLQAVAGILQHNVRNSDIVARFGGDEFLIVLPETDGETDLVEKRILAEVALRNKTNPLLDFAVTLAIGSVHWSPDGETSMEEALAEADRLMYENKRSMAASDT